MLFAGGKRLAYEEEIPFRNLIVFDKGIPVHKNTTIELSQTTEPLSLKINTNAPWQAFVPLASVIEDHWYTYSFYAKISNMPGGVFFYTNTNQFDDQLGIVDLSSWKLQVNSTRVSALRESNGLDLTNCIRQNNLQNTEMKISVTFRASKSGQTGFALESDASGFEFYAGLWNFKETPWCSAYEDYAAKSDFENKVNVDSSLYHSITNNDTWTNIIGTDNNQKSVLTSLRDDSSNGDGPTVGNHGSGIAFGGWDTKAVLSVDFDSPKARIAGGNADKPAWHEDIAWKSDLTTKTIIQDVDINTLTNEGSFFVESNNLDHFPAEYRNQWYFLNVTNPTGGIERVKQTVMPDHSDIGWVMTRTGTYNSDTHTMGWERWLILDFTNGKLLKSK